MADTNIMDQSERQSESFNLSGHDDFEKLDAPSGGFDHHEEPVGDTTGGAYDPNQDREISTTTSADANFSGEEEAEEDLYDIHSSEAEAVAPHAEKFSHEDEQDDYSHDVVSSEPGSGDSEIERVQPSAPVPEKHEPLINFDSPEDDHPTSKSPVSLPSIMPEPIIPTNNLPPQPQPPEDHKAFETEKERESVRETEPPKVKEQTSVEKSKGNRTCLRHLVLSQLVSASVYNMLKRLF